MRFELLLLRHAKSAWPFGVTDANRPLARRGIENASRLGGWFGQQSEEGNSLTPDVILTSPAQRAQHTIDLVVSSAAMAVEPQVEPRLYDATWWDVLDVVREVPSSTRRLLVVGHNPCLEDLAIELAGPDSDPSALAGLRTKFPTGALAVLQSAQRWSEWGSNQASLQLFRTPRGSRG